MSTARRSAAFLVSLLALGALTGCPDPPPDSPVYGVANQCFVLGNPTVAAVPPDELAATAAGDAYAFSASGTGAPFYMKPSGLGTYVLRDDAGSYLVSDGTSLQRESDLLSDVLLIDDSFESNAIWEFESSGTIADRKLRLIHLKSGRYLGRDALVNDVADAASLMLLPSTDCADFPEASVDAIGQVRPYSFPDGSLYGFVDTHSHILSNFAFGGGGIFHGAPFHPLGIEHALVDCELYHGVEGRKDLFGFGFDSQNSDIGALLGSFLFGETPEANHATAGWPEFTDWPNAPGSSTHQVQYYKWLERAYMGGLRLVVQHATSNQIICDLIAGLGAQQVRYACNDMVAVDRIIEETYNLQDYIDAQEGGPGFGWFRIVTTPAEARKVIRDGKMAVILGIETSNLFDCFLVPSAEYPACTPADVVAKLDDYHARGVRAIFPVHKYDNAFSAGDGQKLFIELGNFIQTGHFSNYTNDCDPNTPTVFDRGAASFPGLIQPRADYLSPPPNDLTGFPTNPIGTLIPFLGVLIDQGGTEEVCQAAGLTSLGGFLIEQMMQRGMLIEIDHLPRRSYSATFEMLRQNDYPAVGTHGMNNSGELYALGGVSKTGFRRCRSASASATMDDGFQARIDLVAANGAFPAEGFGFDLNGFAGAPGPRFGPNSGCQNQDDPVTYPFTSFDGLIEFQEPKVGNRQIDFNTEGMVHIGLVPELIEDVRRDGVSDAELEPLFKSAEGYIRMWEKAERRAAELAQ